MTTKRFIRQQIFQKLFNDDTLYNMVDGAIYSGMSEDKVIDNLGSTHKSLISVAFDTSLTTGTTGSASSKIKDVYGEITISIASAYNNSDEYVHKIAEYIEDMVFFDINETLAGVTTYQFVQSVPTEIFYDKDLMMWCAAITFRINYRTTGQY